MSAERRILASIHDVAPCFESEVSRLLDLIQPMVNDRLALLVVPNHWDRAPLIPGSPFAAKLRRWSDRGFEVFLHGFYHRDTTEHARRSDRVRARFMTAREGEFLGLDRTEAKRRISAGQALLEDIIGRPIAGFIAPAWLYGPAALEALAECELPIAEDHLHVWSPQTGAVLSRSPVITWASRSRGRRVSSILAAAALRRLPFRDLRIGVHPGDCSSNRLINSIKRTFEIAARGRRPSAYRDLLNA